MRPHAVPERQPNVWVGLLGLIAYAIPTVIVLVAALILLLSLQPAPVLP